MGAVQLLIVSTLPKKAGAGPKKECPYCKESIHPEAVVCPHCRRELSESEIAQQ